MSDRPVKPTVKKRLGKSEKKRSYADRIIGPLPTTLHNRSILMKNSTRESG
jgi:hypothetical protein